MTTDQIDYPMTLQELERTVITAGEALAEALLAMRERCNDHDKREIDGRLEVFALCAGRLSSALSAATAEENEPPCPHCAGKWRTRGSWFM